MNNALNNYSKNIVRAIVITCLFILTPVLAQEKAKDKVVPEPSELSQVKTNEVKVGEVQVSEAKKKDQSANKKVNDITNQQAVKNNAEALVLENEVKEKQVIENEFIPTEEISEDLSVSFPVDI